MSISNCMSLSRKNLGKLKTFIKKNNFANNNLCNNPKESHNKTEFDEPSKIFYSIIDNSENINETSKENSLLKKSEDIFYNLNSRKTKNSNNLSIEEELYDEFNYLIDE